MLHYKILQLLKACAHNNFIIPYNVNNLKCTCFYCINTNFLLQK